MNAMLIELRRRSLQLTIRDGRLRIAGRLDSSDLIPAMRERRSAFTRRAAWEQDLQQRMVYSHLRGETIELAHGYQSLSSIDAGAPVRYTPIEIARLAGKPRWMIEMLHAIKLMFGGEVVE